MIKRIIFDLDDTLLFTEEDVLKTVNKVLNKEKIKISNQLLSNIIDSFYFYEKEYKIYDLKNYTSFFNKKYNYSFDVSLMQKINDEFSKLSRKQPNVENTLKYLVEKYELVVLTNYYTEVQTKRLEKAGILKYFKKIYCADKIPCKPNKEGYIIAKDKLNFNECLFVGDNNVNDYLTPKKIGMSAILYDPNNKHSNIKNKITDLIELKERL